MPPAFLPLLQLVGLIAVGVVLRSRLLVFLFTAAAAGMVAIAMGSTNLLARAPEQLAMDFGGIALGMLAGLWAVGVRRRQVEAKRWAREIEEASLRRRGARHMWVVTGWVAMLMVALAAALGLYVEGALVPAWRATVDGWLASPTVRALWSRGTQTSAAPAAGTPRARHTTTNPDRPQGDLRHCLELGGQADVRRCAEQGR